MSLKITIETEDGETRNVHADLESIERVEEAIDFKEKSLEVKGGRPNEVEEVFKKIQKNIDSKLYLYACREYLEAKKTFAPATIAKLNSKLEEANIEFTDKQKEEARKLMIEEIKNI